MNHLFSFENSKTRLDSMLRSNLCMDKRVRGQYRKVPGCCTKGFKCQQFKGMVLGVPGPDVGEGGRWSTYRRQHRIMLHNVWTPYAKQTLSLRATSIPTPLEPELLNSHLCWECSCASVRIGSAKGPLVLWMNREPRWNYACQASNARCRAPACCLLPLHLGLSLGRG